VRIGIIGAGQLGRMLALAGYPLGQRFVFLDHSADAPGGQVGQIICGEFGDRERLAELASRVDILTYDVENVPAEAVEEVARAKPFQPPPAALAAGQDRLHEKRLFERLGIPTPEFRTVDDRTQLDFAVAAVGLPAVLKTRRLGYDGRGQHVSRTTADVGVAWNKLGGVPLILEQFVPFVSDYKFFDDMGVKTYAHGHSYSGVNFSIHSAYSAIPEYEQAMKRAYGEERAQKILGTTTRPTP